MATDAKTDMTEAELLHFYLGLRLEKGKRDGTLDEVLADFSEFLRQRDKVRALIQEAEESSARGMSKVMSDEDVEQIISRVEQRLADEGITE